MPDDDDPVHRVAARHVCAVAAAAGAGEPPRPDLSESPRRGALA